MSRISDFSAPVPHPAAQPDDVERSSPPPASPGQGAPSSARDADVLSDRVTQGVPVARALSQGVMAPAIGGTPAARVLSGAAPLEPKNPLLAEWRGPFGAAPLDRITAKHFPAAFEAAMKDHLSEIDAIANQSDAPTFENTIAAFDRSGDLLGRVAGIFYLLHGADGNDGLDEVDRTYAPKLAQHNLDIVLNRALFARIDALWNDREKLVLNPEQLRVLTVIHQQFVREGAALDAGGRARLSQINSRLAELQSEFGARLKRDTVEHALVVDRAEDLEGVPPGEVAAAAEEARARGLDGKWVFTLSNTPNNVAFLYSAKNRALRKKAYLDTVNRGRRGDENDTRAILKEILSLRQERAQLLGGIDGRYPTSAHHAMDDRVVKTPEELYAFMEKIRAPALAAVDRERAELEALLHADGISGPLEPWDWLYYAEQVRRSRFELDQSQLKPYFELNQVRDGIFAVTKRLFNLDFVRRTDVPVYNEEVQVFEVQREGKHVGLVYFDFFSRGSKRGGAWMDALRQQGAGTTPIVYNVCNVPKPAPGEPALVDVENVQTMFHEFGHALHGLLSNVTYQTLAGTSVPSDFVEMPSQIFEQWALAPEVLRTYAKHHQTGEVIPQELIDKLEASRRYGEGFATTSYLASAYLDLDWHARPEALAAEPDAFEAASMARFGLPHAVWPRYQTANFSHIFDGGYWAGYGSYAVSEMMDADGFDLFAQRGLFDPETATKFERLLASGNTKEAMELFVEFRGRPPLVEPLLRRKGFID